MFARTALFALTLVVSSCSKTQPLVQLHEPVGAKLVAIETPAPSVEKPEAVPGQIDPAVFAHVVKESGELYVVLSATPEHERWAQGAPRLMSKDSPVVVRRDVDTSLLPKTMSRVAGRAMRLWGVKGEVCHGKLAQPFLMSRVEPHFGERSRWEGEEQDDGTKTPALTDEQVAQIGWDLDSNGKLLVAELVDTAGDCQDARFARAADLQALATTAGRQPSSSLSKQALAALEKLPAYEVNEKAYRASSQATPSKSWIESQNASLDMIEFSTGKATYVWVSASGGEVCSDFSANLNVLWKVSGTNAKTFEFEVVYEGEATFSPLMLVQLPGDAVPSLLGVESLLRKDTKVYDVEDLHVPFLDCPC